MRLYFKAKPIDNSVSWIKGNYSEVDCSAFIENTERKLRVKSKTVSIFLGKSAINGQEVWSNDIVRTSKGNIGVIKFDEFALKFILEFPNDSVGKNIDFNDILYCEPLGNIFDNSIEEFKKKEKTNVR